jgi:hypothetical protein
MHQPMGREPATFAVRSPDDQDAEQLEVDQASYGFKDAPNC